MCVLHTDDLEKKVGKCSSNKACPEEVRACCQMMIDVLRHSVEPHSCVHACRDVASRCAVRAWKTPGAKGEWKGVCMCCFELCDALDGFCHQRIPLREALAHPHLRCAFSKGPVLPNTKRYLPSSSVPFSSSQKECVVYCASTSCGASAEYRHGLPGQLASREYPGGLLEYACRCACDDPAIRASPHPRMSDSDVKKCKSMDFNHCGTEGRHCFP